MFKKFLAVALSATMALSFDSVVSQRTQRELPQITEQSHWQIIRDW